MDHPLLAVRPLQAGYGRAQVLFDVSFEVRGHRVAGLAQIVIDKNVKRLLPLADRHYVLEKGRVVWQGDSRALQAQAAVVHQYLGV